MKKRKLRKRIKELEKQLDSMFDWNDELLDRINKMLIEIKGLNYLKGMK